MTTGKHWLSGNVCLGCQHWEINVLGCAYRSTLILRRVPLSSPKAVLPSFLTAILPELSEVTSQGDLTFRE